MSKIQNTKKIVLVAGIVLLLALLVSLVVVSARRDETKIDDAEPATQTFAQGGPMNILVVGADRASGLHDMIMLVRVEPDVPSVVILQIPRDTYAAYTENSYRKLNGASRALGGVEEMCEFLSEGFGISIDRYVSLDADVIATVVDAIGGVEITLPYALDYDDPAQSLSIHLPAGRQTLGGREAEYFVRYREGYVRGDLGRMDAQKLFFAALASKMRSSMNVASAVKLAAAVMPRIDTNLTLPEVARLARTTLSADEENILMLTLPGEDVVATRSGASYYVLSAPTTAEVLICHFGATAGSFDRERVFCNPRYDSFCKIYDEAHAYEIYSMGEIAGEGIEIEKTRR